MLQKANARPAVLFVCLGNICRSPMAEGAFRKAAAEAGLDIDVDSAGTADYHIGEPPDARAVAEAQRHDVNISQLLGRQIEREDFERFTHIFALDKANLAGIEARAPRGSRAIVAMLMDVVPGSEGEAIADPYHGDQTDFAETWKQINIAVEALVERFRREALEHDL